MTDSNKPRFRVPLFDPKRQYDFLRDDIDTAISRALNHQGWVNGPEVRELETRVAEYVGTKHAVGCASGTDALLLALRALAQQRTGREYFRSEDEIITTAFSHPATADAIVRAGATPVFVDIDRTSFNIAPAQIRTAITSRTVGIVPVHLYGQACCLDEIIAIAREHRLFVVEDAAQAFGARCGSRRCGSFGDAAAFSFGPESNLSGFGEGGMVTTDDPELVRIIDSLRRHGTNGTESADLLGYNSRLDTLQAAVLLAKLNHIEAFNGLRRQIAIQYTRTFGRIAGITPPPFPQNGEHVYNGYTLRSTNRDRLIHYLCDRNVGCAVRYGLPLHKMKAFANRARVAGPLLETEQAAAEVVSLPMEPLMSEKEFATVVAAVQDGAADR